MTRSAAALVLWISFACWACDSGSEEIVEDQRAAEETEPAPDADSVVVDLYPGRGSYVLARLDVGTLAFALDTIRKSGEGADIVLRIGNTTAAGLEDLMATLQWGPLGADSTPQTSPSRTREVPVSSNVQAGKWTRAIITLADVPPSELGFIRLSNIDHMGLILR